MNKPEAIIFKALNTLPFKAKPFKALLIYPIIKSLAVYFAYIIICFIISKLIFCKLVNKI